MRILSKIMILGIILLLPAILIAHDPQPNPTPGKDHPTPPVVNPEDDPSPVPRDDRRRRGRGGAERPSPEDAGNKQRPERRYKEGLIKRLDRNNDGVLDKKELKSLPKMFRLRLKKLDRNRDGIIDYRELGVNHKGRKGNRKVPPSSNQKIQTPSCQCQQHRRPSNDRTMRTRHHLPSSMGTKR